MFFQEENFLSNVMRVRKLNKNLPIIENIRDKDEKINFIEMKQEEAQPEISDQSTSKTSLPKIVFHEEVIFPTQNCFYSFYLVE